MASRRTGTIFESSRKNEPFHVQNDDRHPVGPVGETANPGRSKPRNQRRIEFLRSTALQVQKRTGHNKAAIATANKLARIVFAVLKRGTLYEPNLAR